MRCTSLSTISPHGSPGFCGVVVGTFGCSGGGGADRGVAVAVAAAVVVGLVVTVVVAGTVVAR